MISSPSPATIPTTVPFAPSVARNGPAMLRAPSYVASAKRLTTPTRTTNLSALRRAPPPPPPPPPPAPPPPPPPPRARRTRRAKKSPLPALPVGVISPRVRALPGEPHRLHVNLRVH